MSGVVDEYQAVVEAHANLKAAKEAERDRNAEVTIARDALQAAMDAQRAAKTHRERVQSVLDELSDLP